MTQQERKLMLEVSKSKAEKLAKNPLYAAASGLVLDLIDVINSMNEEIKNNGKS